MNIYFVHISHSTAQKHFTTFFHLSTHGPSRFARSGIVRCAVSLQPQHSATQRLQSQPACSDAGGGRARRGGKVALPSEGAPAAACRATPACKHSAPAVHATFWRTAVDQRSSIDTAAGAVTAWCTLCGSHAISIVELLASHRILYRPLLRGGGK